MAMKEKVLTLLIIQQGDRVLLGEKKRGFGASYVNGFGGKVEPNETVREAAARELHEEAGVIVDPSAIQKLGLLTFHFDDNPLVPWKVHLFKSDTYAGTECETDEMRPRWFNINEIPYDKMWADDIYWYPLFLEGRPFLGEFYFKETHNLVKHEIRPVSQVELEAAAGK